MSVVQRLRVQLSGSAIVGTGVSTWYWEDNLGGEQSAIADFYDAVKTAFPDKLTVTVPNNGDQITVETGQLAGTWTDGSVEVITGTDTGNFILGTGARLVLNTGGMTAGRRVRGSIFLVPLGVAVFNEDDALANSFVTGVNGAAATLLAAVPSLAVVSPVKPPPGGIGPDRPGKSSIVTSISCKDAVSWLRSRRT